MTSQMRHRDLAFTFALACLPAFSFFVPPMTTRFLPSSNSPYTAGQGRSLPVHDDRVPVGRCKSRMLAAPEFLSNEAVTVYHNPDSTSKMWLLGVVHDATKSSQLVERVIRKVKPQAVMVEVDPVRIRLLPPGEAEEDSDGLWWWSPMQNADKVTGDGDGDQAKYDEQEGPQQQGRGSQATTPKSPRSKGQGKKEGSKHDPGAKDVCEFSTAARVAAACGARVLLGDRDFEEVQRRLAEAEDADKREARDAKGKHAEKAAARITCRGYEGTPPAVWRKMRDLQKSWGPRKFAILMTERDEVMANNLLKLEGNQSSVVAVIGAHHTVGIGRILAANGWRARRK